MASGEGPHCRSAWTRACPWGPVLMWAVSSPVGPQQEEGEGQARAITLFPSCKNNLQRHSMAGRWGKRGQARQGSGSGWVRVWLGPGQAGQGQVGSGSGWVRVWLGQSQIRSESGWVKVRQGQGLAGSGSGGVRVRQGCSGLIRGRLGLSHTGLGQAGQWQAELGRVKVRRGQLLIGSKSGRVRAR